MIYREMLPSDYTLLKDFLYGRIGFETVDENDEEYIMVYKY